MRHALTRKRANVRATWKPARIDLPLTDLSGSIVRSQWLLRRCGKARGGRCSRSYMTDEQRSPQRRRKPPAGRPRAARRRRCAPLTWNHHAHARTPCQQAALPERLVHPAQGEGRALLDPVIPARKRPFRLRRDHTSQEPRTASGRQTDPPGCGLPAPSDVRLRPVLSPPLPRGLRWHHPRRPE